MYRRLVIAGLAACVALQSATAQGMREWMQEAEIKAELTGVRLSGLYPTKIAWSEDINPDGTSNYAEGPQQRPGRWNVAGELYCFVYALPHQGGCFRIVKQSANCYELYTASIGGEAPSPPPPATAMAWNGRMWRDAERGTCEERPIS